MRLTVELAAEGSVGFSALKALLMVMLATLLVGPYNVPVLLAVFEAVEVSLAGCVARSVGWLGELKTALDRAMKLLLRYGKPNAQDNTRRAA